MAILGNIKKIKGVNKALDAVRKETEQEISIAIIAIPKVEVELAAMLQLNADKKVVFGAGELQREAGRGVGLRGADLALAIIDIAENKDRHKAIVKRAYEARSKLLVVTGSGFHEALAGELRDAFKAEDDDIVYVPAFDSTTISTVLIPEIVRKLEKKKLALGARLPLFREAVVDDVIAETAKQNVLIGVAVFIPGADMPLITLNQIKMVLRIAAVYGEELSIKRFNEVLAVLGGGFAFRAVAREAIGFIPVAGWAVKGAVAYGGTFAMGEAAKKHFS